MIYIKYFENLVSHPNWWQIRPYLIDKYVVIKSDNSNNYFLIEIKEEMIGDRLNANKLFTLKNDNKIKKNKHQYYTVSPDDLDKRTIYKSSDLLASYGVLKSLNDAGKYNL